MPDEASSDVISGGRDPDHRRAGLGRVLAGVAVAALVAGVVALQVNSHLTRSAPYPPPSPSPVALTAPQMLHGTPLRPGGAPAAQLFLGGDDLRLLNVPGQAQVSLADVLQDGGDTQDPLGPGAAVQQIISADGGVVALIDGQGAAGLPDIGDVLFIPVGTRGAGLPRIIARANYMAAAPDHRGVWVEQAGPPWGNGPSDSPAWLAGDNGQRLSGIVHLNDQELIADTLPGLLLQSPDRGLALMTPSNGRIEPAGIPQDSVIVAADADQVAWQDPACPPDCTLHVTDLRGGAGTQLTLPPGTVINTNDTADFDPAGQRLALALDSVDRQGTAAADTYVYVADLRTGKLTRVPGGPIPVVTLPVVPGAFPYGSSTVVCVRWSATGSGLWIVATDGLFFQAGYWTGRGPLRVLQPQTGLAYKLALPGPAA
jgi:hypothetical protein